jgi:hypothetical protein
MTLSHTAKEQGVGVEGTQHRKRKFVPARWTEGNSLTLPEMGQADGLHSWGAEKERVWEFWAG